MLRYDRSRRTPPNYLGRSQQWRLFSLVVALGFLLILAGQLRDQRGIELLRIFFGDPAHPGQDPQRLADQALAQLSRRPAGSTAPTRSVPKLPPTLADELAEVRDNTAFESTEAGPWNHVLDLLQNAPQDELEADSLGELTAVQLLEQPEVYRGQLITISGIARQSVALAPPVLHPTPREWAQICLVPELGFAALSTRAILRTAMLSGYHRVGIQQPGASVPIVVFTLELPESFPKGEPIREQVAVTGYFFKNWLFASGDGLSVAPIVLAKRIGWHRRPSRVREDVAANSRDVLLVIALASVFGILTTWWLWTRVRTAGKKPSRGALTGSTAPDFSSIGRLLPHESRVLNERS